MRLRALGGGGGGGTNLCSMGGVLDVGWSPKPGIEISGEDRVVLFRGVRLLDLNHKDPEKQVAE